MLSCLAYDSWLVFFCRYVETEAYKAFRDTGKMQFPEFGTQVPALKTLWLTFLGMTGLGKGASMWNMKMSFWPVTCIFIFSNEMPILF